MADQKNPQSGNQRRGGDQGNPNQLWIHLDVADPVPAEKKWRSSAMIRIEERGRKARFEHPFAVYIIFAGNTDKMTDGKTARGSGRSAFDFTVDEPGKYKFQAQTTGDDGSVWVSDIQMFTIPKPEEKKAPCILGIEAKRRGGNAALTVKYKFTAQGWVKGKGVIDTGLQRKLVEPGETIEEVYPKDNETKEYTVTVTAPVGEKTETASITVRIPAKKKVEAPAPMKERVLRVRVCHQTGNNYELRCWVFEKEGAIPVVDAPIEFEGEPHVCGTVRTNSEGFAKHSVDTHGNQTRVICSTPSAQLSRKILY